MSRTHALAGLMVGAVSLAAVLSVDAATTKFPLLEAARKGDSATVAKLVAEKADVNVAEPDGTTALHWASHVGDGRSVDVLLKAGANPKAATRNGATPYSLALYRG